MHNIKPNFSASIIEALSKLKLSSRRSSLRIFGGVHKSDIVGRGVNIRDYRKYAQGDDVRLVDFNVYARTKQLYMKIADIPSLQKVGIAMDCSESMNTGNPTKLSVARKVATLLSYVALFQKDELYIGLIGRSGDMIKFRGKEKLNSVIDAIENLDGENRESGYDSILASLSKVSGHGMSALITDGYDSDLVSKYLFSVRKNSSRNFVIVIDSKYDNDPGVFGDVLLKDAETSAEHFAFADRDLINTYRRKRSEYFDDLFAKIMRMNAAVVKIDDVPEIDLSIIKTLLISGVLVF
ncbi:MAG: DUF58 domain-containing protein [Planctomycetes bacterium]|nr:DUF58 domain-containing protein [Planctomycetota bacterium]